MESDSDNDLIEGTTEQSVVAPPGNVTATPTATTRIRVTWDAVIHMPAPVSGYFIAMQTNNAGPFVPKGSVKASSPRSIIIANLSPTDTYIFEVKALAGDEVSPGANSASVQTLQPVPPGSGPTGLGGSAFAPDRAELHWDTTVGATGYVVESAPTGSPTTYLATVHQPAGASTSLTVANLNPSLSYDYSVRAVLPGGVTGASLVTVAQTALPRPTTPVVTGAVVSTTALSFTWAAIDQTTTTTYQIYFGEGANLPEFVTTLRSTNTLAFNPRDLTQGTAYTINVYAVTATGSISLAGAATATPDDPAAAR